MLTIKLNLEHKDINNPVISLLNLLEPEVSLSLSNLSNLSTYLDLASKHTNPTTVINANEEILQAINYDSDDNNNYWAILTSDFVFIDVAIPLVADLDDEKLYENFSSSETKVLKSLKDYLN